MLTGGHFNVCFHFLLYRAFPCTKTDAAYGSVNGTAFADFSHSILCPCGADITEILIRESIVINGIRVTYKTAEGETVVAPMRGKASGRTGIMHLQKGERITGVTGVTCVQSLFERPNRYVTQLVFFSENEDGQRAVHGPYGRSSGLHDSCQLFAVNGMITSTFGRVLTVEGYSGLGAIGFYFEDSGPAKQST